MAWQFKMAPESTYLCKIKATFTTQLNMAKSVFLLKYIFFVRLFT